MHSFFCKILYFYRILFCIFYFILFYFSVTIYPSLPSSTAIHSHPSTITILSSISMSFLLKEASFSSISVTRNVGRYLFYSFSHLLFYWKDYFNHCYLNLHCLIPGNPNMNSGSVQKQGSLGTDHSKESCIQVNLSVGFLCAMQSVTHVTSLK